MNQPDERDDELDDEIDRLAVEIDHLPPGDPDELPLRVEYGRLHWLRYNQRQDADADSVDLTDLNLAIEAFGLAAWALPPNVDPAAEAWLRGALGDALMQRLERGGGLPDDLDWAIKLMRVALDLLPPGSPDWFDRGDGLAGLYLDRCDLTEDPADADRAAAVLTLLLDTPGRSPDEAAFAQRQLGFAHALRHRHGGEQVDRDRAITALAIALRYQPTEPLAATLYAELLTERAGAGDRDEDFLAAVGALGPVLADPDLTGPDRAEIDRFLSGRYLDRYMTGRDRAGSPVGEYLLAGHRHAAAVLANPWADTETRDIALILRACSRTEYVRISDDPQAEIETVIADLEEVLPRVDEQLRHTAGALLAMGLLDRARRSLDPAALDRAVEVTAGVLDGMAPDDVTRVEVSLMLAQALFAQFDYARMALTSLDQVIVLLRQVVAARSADPAVAAGAHHGLGAALVHRAVYFGEVGGDDVDEAIEHLMTAFRLVAAGDSLRLPVLVALANALTHRYTMRGDLADVQRCMTLLRNARHDERWGPSMELIIDATLGQVLVVWAVDGGGDLDEAVALLQGCASRLSPEHGVTARVRSALAVALGLRAARSRQPEDWRDALRHGSQAAAAIRPDHPEAAIVRAQVGTVMYLASHAIGDVAGMRAAVDNLRAAVAATPPTAPVRPRCLGALGVALLGLHRMSPESVRLAELVEVLEEGYALQPGDGHPHQATSAMVLAEAYWYAARPADAVAVGQVALRAHAWGVLLQSGTANAMTAARLAAEHAVTLAQWCLAIGRRADALASLESGRGLVLHAATVTAQVPDLLRRAGEAGLAEEWRAAARTTPFHIEFAADDWRIHTPALPSDLRRRALAALAGQARLFAPPDLATLTAALRELRTDALVYLFPGKDLVVGRALLVTAAGGIDEIALPELVDDGPAGHHRSGYRSGAEHRDVEPNPAAGWQAGPDAEQELSELCGWAWRVAMGPLLARYAGRQPYLTLIPAGTLARVPWHAAQSPPDADGTVRCVIDEATVSYISSGRLLVEIAGRTAPRIGERALVIGNPDTGDPGENLPNAGIEATEIYGRYYRAGRYLGRPAALADGAGVPADIFDWIGRRTTPHPTVLHLACHAFVRSDGPATSFLKLSGGTTVSAEEILHAAATREAGDALGLVSLAACSTHLAGRAYDEAVTLATVFLVAGASGAVGALWRVPDRETALLMLAFHEYLVRGSLPPRDALRAAQRWLRGTTREAFADLPESLRDTAIAEPSLASWAGFVHVGA